MASIVTKGTAVATTDTTLDITLLDNINSGDAIYIITYIHDYMAAGIDYATGSGSKTNTPTGYTRRLNAGKINTGGDSKHYSWMQAYWKWADGSEGGTDITLTRSVEDNDIVYLANSLVIKNAGEDPYNGDPFWYGSTGYVSGDSVTASAFPVGGEYDYTPGNLVLVIIGQSTDSPTIVQPTSYNTLGTDTSSLGEGAQLNWFWAYNSTAISTTGGTTNGGVVSCVEVFAGDPDRLTTPIKDVITLEALRNIEMSAMGRFFIDKSGNAKYESRYARTQ